jgi:hypothetical protein
MKIRQGFVSNSSSSSFVLVVSVADHAKAVAALTPEDQAKMRKVCTGSNSLMMKKVGAEEVVVITGGDYEEFWVRGNMYSEEECEDAPDGMDYYKYWEQQREFWGRYIEQLVVLKQDTIWGTVTLKCLRVKKVIAWTTSMCLTA